MPNPTPSGAAGGGTQGTTEDSGSTITVNTKTPSNFPPPKTDKPRPHVCATCQRSFARLEHLKRHERSHTKEKPFECPECARCFARRDLLLRHQQKLHQTSAPSSRPRNRRESASGIGPAQSRARKNSVAGANPAGGAGSVTTSMRPRANTISHVDGAAMQMIASANVNVARGMAAHSRHPSLAGLPVHGLDHVFGGMSVALGQRGIHHGLPKLETAQIASADFENGLRTAPPMAVFNPEFDFDGLLFGTSSTINPNALHYSDSPQSMAMDQNSPFGQGINDISSNQPFDDGLDWLTGFEHQMSFQTNENVVDGSSPSAISTTSQSGISDVMLDGSNHPAPAGTSNMWQSSLMGPPQVPNPFAMELNGSVFPDLLNGAPLSPQPASQKINDPYFSTPPPSLSSLSPSIMSGLNAQKLNPTLGYAAGPETPSSLGGGNNCVSPVTTISDATRAAIVNALSHNVSFGGRKYSITSQSSPMSPQLQSGANTGYAQGTPALPNTQDLQRYVGAYLTYFHPHLPFLHIPTLSFDPSSASGGRSNGVGGSGCLVLSMAAIGALYESEHSQSRDLFDMAKKMVFFYLDERKRADSRRAEAHRGAAKGDATSKNQRTSPQAPVWLVQAMLLNVVYGHNSADKTASDIASTQSASLMGLAEAANLVRPDRSGATNRDVRMVDDTNWTRQSDQEDHQEWLQWKDTEERKRTLYAVFIMSSLLVTAYNDTPALTNSEILLDLPCDEDFYAAESGAAFSAKGGVKAAEHNRVTFYDALGELLRTREKNQKQTRLKHGHAVEATASPLAEQKPSTFGCLILINALHNYIWETRQRHHGKAWTHEEVEKMHRHIEPALKAWQLAWSSNPHHSVERPNPFGLGPLSADAIPLLDLAYVRLFVNLSRSREKFWQRDWEGVIDELVHGDETAWKMESQSGGPDASDISDKSSEAMFIGDGSGGSPIDFSERKLSASGEELGFYNEPTSRREQYLRRAAFYAADSLAMSDKLGVTFADFTSRELPLQSALCAFDCAQVLAEWIATLQDRVGRFLGILGQDSEDLGQIPAMMLLEEEDLKLLNKIREILTSAEMKLNLSMIPDAMNGNESAFLFGSHGGLAARLLRLTASMMDKAAVWPVTQLMARCLEAHANHAQTRAEKSVTLTV
ncbi:hypothetical protein HIM_08556 [Hirsutella minnesotensis 3608]|uniref:C2H2-type domain-containing protein n=1 Tax=Hirsutella minnesotensis 3608 TaxID=1043627 RepID=A0A0F7ZH65_9HYPO|nr:hypothetical protein HIM_08556 [Hirsutella minnesotensis 3608]